MARPRPLALITGASSGIGLELARIYAREGFELALVARRGEALERLAQELREKHGSQVHLFALDLAQAGSAAALLEALRARELAVDTLVNNAGFGYCGPFIDMPAETLAAMLQLNVVTLSELAHACGREMAARQGGTILNVASLAAFQPGPLMAVYYASKAFVLSLSEGLSVELAPHGVKVTALCPGPTATDFAARAKLQGTRLTQGILPVMSAREVAEAGFQGAKAGKSVVIPGLTYQLSAWASRVLPRGLLARGAYAMHRQRDA
jgi:short-subunit dehydrogenase